MIATMVITIALTATSMDAFVDHLKQMFGLRPPAMQNLQGIWKFWNSVYRLPVLAGFVALSAAMAIWPTRKNLGTLISGTASIMLSAQFWHAHGGGVYVAWYLPLLLATIFRPNVEDRTSAAMIDEGLFTRRAAR